MHTITLYRRHVQTLAGEAEAENDRIRKTARELYIAGDELGAAHLLASEMALLPMQRIGYVGNMLAALGTLEGNIARLVVYGGFSDPLAPILAEIDCEARAAAAEMQHLESLGEAAQSSDTESAWYEARGRHEALNKALRLLTGYTQTPAGDGVASGDERAVPSAGAPRPRQSVRELLRQAGEVPPLQKQEARPPDLPPARS